MEEIKLNAIELEKIKQKALEEHIPIMRQPPLARALFAEGSEEQYVPSDLLVQVAEVLRFIDKMRTN